MKNVLVFVEFLDGKPTKAGLQALGAGHRLAGQLGGETIALVAGEGAEAEAPTLSACGASKVQVAAGDTFKI
jgi:electron transfer flavoprotein alpha subunit